jgi:hypothetical protein
MSGWISVKDRMPLQKGVYLVNSKEEADSYFGIFVADWNGKYFNDWPPNCGCTGISKITHWMPLPEAPHD